MAQRRETRLDGGPPLPETKPLKELLFNLYLFALIEMLKDAAFFLQLEASCLQWSFLLVVVFGSFLLTVEAFLLTVETFLLTVGAFLLTVGKWSQ